MLPQSQCALLCLVNTVSLMLPATPGSYNLLQRSMILGDIGVVCTSVLSRDEHPQLLILYTLTSWQFLYFLASTARRTFSDEG